MNPELPNVTDKEIKDCDSHSLFIEREVYRNSTPYETETEQKRIFKIVDRMNAELKNRKYPKRKRTNSKL